MIGRVEGDVWAGSEPDSDDDCSRFERPSGDIQEDFENVWTSDAILGLPVNSSAIQTRLSQVLIAWKSADGETVPKKLLLLLEHTYSSPNIHQAALKGSDAAKTAFLARAAAEDGFALGLATIDCRLAGIANDEWGHPRTGVDFEEVQDDTITIENLVDMSGRLLEAAVEFYDCETVPAELADDIVDGRHHREEYEPRTGFDPGTLQRWYRRSVLAIWPERSQISTRYRGPAGFSRALVALKGSVLKTQTPAVDRALFDTVLYHPNRVDGQAAQVCARIACQWRDAELWCKTIQSFADGHGVDVLPGDMCLEAATVLGFNNVRAAFECMLCADQRTAARLEFLAKVYDWMRTRPPTARKKIAKEVEPWVAAQTQVVLAALKNPQRSECGPLVKAARRNGGIVFLQKFMLPHFLAAADNTFLVGFAAEVNKEGSFEQPFKGDVTRSLLASAIDKTEFFPAFWPPPDSPEMYSALGQQYARTCIRLGFSDLAGIVLKRISLALSACPKTAEASSFARKVAIPLSSFLTELQKADPRFANMPELEELRRRVVRIAY
ncbi:hypothetical protein PsYK624_034500 [Phanerochaete sordida]|uniref:Uncharacterized protein n=1 Tax=Phanerochaete sordida TaxID=48140 RepID=A0A9P3G1N0_9APHY|nr:hypothetical protein PsYK624_034500 [Phanerochaete sordida]